MALASFTITSDAAGARTAAIVVESGHIKITANSKVRKVYSEERTLKALLRYLGVVQNDFTDKTVLT